MLSTNAEYMEDFKEPNKYQDSMTFASIFYFILVIFYSCLTVFSLIMALIRKYIFNFIKIRGKCEKIYKFNKTHTKNEKNINVDLTKNEI